MMCHVPRAIREHPRVFGPGLAWLLVAACGEPVDAFATETSSAGEAASPSSSLEPLLGGAVWKSCCRFALSIEGQETGAALFDAPGLADLLGKWDGGPWFLLQPAERRVFTLPGQAIALGADGRTPMYVGPFPEESGEVELNETALEFTVDGVGLRVISQPPLIGRVTMEEFLGLCPEYAEREARYRPQAEAMLGLAQVDSEVTLEVYFGSWCPHCQVQLPKLARVFDLVANPKLELELHALPRDFGDDPAVVARAVDSLPEIVVVRAGEVIGKVDAENAAPIEMLLAEILDPGRKRPSARTGIVPLTPELAGDPDVVAAVNGHPILRSEWEEATLRESGLQALETLVVARLVREEARERGITVSAKEVDDRVERGIREIVTKRYQGNVALFEEELAELLNATLDEHCESLRSRTQTELLVKKILMQDRPVSELALRTLFVKKYGEDGVRYRARHMQLAGQAEAVRELAETILERLSQGTSFAQLAERYSVDPGTNRSGGILENVRGSRFGADFVQAVVAMRPGAAPQILEVRTGIHVAQLLEVSQTRFEDVVEELVAEVAAQGISPGEIQAFEEQLRAGARVERRIGGLLPSDRIGED